MSTVRVCDLCKTPMPAAVDPSVAPAVSTPADTLIGAVASVVGVYTSTRPEVPSVIRDSWTIDLCASCFGNLATQIKGA